MRTFIPSGLLLLFLTIFLTAATVLFNKGQHAESLIRRDMIGCAPVSDELVTADENGKFMPPLTGWGSHNYTISTTNDSTKFYFNQGLNFFMATI